jgi:hypothetical protein
MQILKIYRLKLNPTDERLTGETPASIGKGKKKKVCKFCPEKSVFIYTVLM